MRRCESGETVSEQRATISRGNTNEFSGFESCVSGIGPWHFCSTPENPVGKDYVNPAIRQAFHQLTNIKFSENLR